MDHDDIIYSPFPFTVRRDLSQSADGPRQLPLPPPGLFPSEKRRRRNYEKRPEKTVRLRPSQGNSSPSVPYSSSMPSSSARSSPARSSPAYSSSACLSPSPRPASPSSLLCFSPRLSFGSWRTAYGPTRLPTSVVRRKSRIGRCHGSSPGVREVCRRHLVPGPKVPNRHRYRAVSKPPGSQGKPPPASPRRMSFS